MKLIIHSVESQIVRALLAELEKAGMVPKKFYTSLYSGCGYTVSATTPDRVCKLLKESSGTLHIQLPSGELAGIMLVSDNGEDVISDYHLGDKGDFGLFTRIVNEFCRRKIVLA